MEAAPLAGSKRRGVLSSRETPSLMGDQLEQKGSLRVSEESPATSLWQAGQSETYSDGPCHSPACPRLKQVSAVATGAGCWNVGFGEQIWGEDHCWL